VARLALDEDIASVPRVPWAALDEGIASTAGGAPSDALAEPRAPGAPEA
jgi:hypothetical protein